MRDGTGALASVTKNTRICAGSAGQSIAISLVEQEVVDECRAPLQAVAPLSTEVG